MSTTGNGHSTPKTTQDIIIELEGVHTRLSGLLKASELVLWETYNTDLANAPLDALSALQEATRCTVEHEFSLIEKLYKAGAA